MSFRTDYERSQQIARERRAHLSVRAMLAGFIWLTEAVGRAATRARRRLDPAGGAEAGR